MSTDPIFDAIQSDPAVIKFYDDMPGYLAKIGKGEIAHHDFTAQWADDNFRNAYFLYVGGNDLPGYQHASDTYVAVSDSAERHVAQYHQSSDVVQAIGRQAGIDFMLRVGQLDIRERNLVRLTQVYVNNPNHMADKLSDIEAGVAKLSTLKNRLRSYRPNTSVSFG